MKTCKKSNVQNFTKLTRSGGISLIVLVITIIVILILASAVILAISNNNPVAEANKARYESDRANMQAVFTNTVAKIMAKNQGVVSIKTSQLNTVTSGVKQTTGEVNYTVENATNEENSSGKIVFDKGDNTDTVFYTGKQLPIYAAGETKWYVDDEGIVSLAVGENKYGEGIIALESIVIDYGLPVKIEQEKIGSSKIVEEKSYATYGDVVIEGDNTTGDWSVTYTLNQMLSDVDTVHLFDEKGQEYVFNVYPATTMYYEENFSNVISYTNGKTSWVEVKDGTTVDNLQDGGVIETNAPYGYDSSYNDDTMFSNGTAMKMDATTGDGYNITYATFTFTGTGFDLISCTNPSGAYIRAEIYQGTKVGTKIYKYAQVATVDSSELYQVPVLSCVGMPHGTYTVRVQVYEAYTSDLLPALNRGGLFYFDAIRIYNPAKGNAEAESVYLKDNEAYPKFTDISNMIADSENIDTVEYLEGAIAIEGIDSSINILSQPNLANNEVFLQKGEGIVFRVTDKNIVGMHLGVKSPTGQETSIKVSELNVKSKTISIKSAAELYYDITDCITWNGDTSNIIVISNENDTNVIVSLTNIKTTYKQESTTDSLFRISLDDVNSVINEYSK